MKEIEIPFVSGGYNSDTMGWEYTIPEGYTAKIEGGKIITKKEESEDERIREKIVGIVKAAPFDEEKDVLLDWLEKQKDITPIVVSNEEWDCQRAYSEGYQKGMAESNKKKPAEWSDTNELVFQDICKHLNEEGYGGWVVLLEALKNGEFSNSQSEWSKEDQNNIGRIITKIEIDKQHWEGHGKTMSDGDDELISWLKSLSSRFSLQPKVEWTEEDEENLDAAIDMAVNSLYEPLVPKDTLVSWLKSLKNRGNFPKSNTNSPSWSEEDEENFKWFDKFFRAESVIAGGRDIPQDKYFWFKSLRPQSKDEIYKEKNEAFKLGKHQLAIAFMKYLDENRPEGKMCLSNGECEDIDKAFKENDWAKIMRYMEKYRPHWKPSEEQMKALLWCTAHLGGADHRVLAELYEHLRKLREE